MIKMNVWFANGETDRKPDEVSFFDTIQEAEACPRMHQDVQVQLEEVMKTVTQVSEIMGVTKQTVHYWIWRNKLKAQRVGSLFIIDDKEDTRAKDEARAQLDSTIEMVRALEKGEEIDGQDPQGRIYEDPLSIEVRSDWHTLCTGGLHNPGIGNATEYRILLCTGGPAVRIIGELDDHQQPETARIEYQDWFTPWIRYADTTDEEDKALLTYARQFYFGD